MGEFSLAYHGCELTRHIPTRSERQIGFSELSCLDAIDDGADSHGLIAVGSWGDNSVQLLSLPSLQPALNTVITESVLATSVRLARSGKGLSLSVGLGDGVLATYLLEPIKGTNLMVATQRKEMSLGRSPVLLSPRRVDDEGNNMMMSMSDRTSVVYTEQDRLSASALGSRVGVRPMRLHRLAC